MSDEVKDQHSIGVDAGMQDAALIKAIYDRRVQSRVRETGDAVR